MCLAVRVRDLIVGYFKDSIKNSELFFQSEGKEWFRTGDTGWLDERGFLIYTGRLCDMIVLKDGSLVSPSALDRVISAHPGVDAAAFFGTNGALEAAVVLRKHASNVTESDLKQWLLSLLPSQLPSRIHFVRMLPRTALGKIQRYQLSNLTIASKL